MLTFENFNEEAKKDLQKLINKVIKFTEKYNLKSIKFEDKCYFDEDDLFIDLVEIEIENFDKSAKDKFSIIRN